MQAAALVYPMAALVSLTAVVLGMMLRTRIRLVRDGDLSAGYFKTYQGHIEPDESAKKTRHVINLFEAPVLFYVACVTAIVVGDGSALMLGLAWVYVAARALHTVVHLGANKILPRMAVYFFSWAILVSMWARLVWFVAAA